MKKLIIGAVVFAGWLAASIAFAVLCGAIGFSVL